MGFIMSLRSGIIIWGNLLSASALIRSAMTMGRIVADHADKAACEKLKNGFTAQELSSIDLKNYPQIIGGFDVVKCKKDLGIDFGISAIKQMELFITENSLNLLTEIYNYCYAQDKFGNWVDKPIDNFNHALDALRYIIVYYFKAGKLRK